MLADERVSGIVPSPSDPDGSIDELRDLGIPVVTLDRALTRATTDLIVADNVPAVRTATQRLIDAGHRRIAFVGGRSEVETGSERQEGYLAAVEPAGLEPIMADGGFRREAVRELLGRPDPPADLGSLPLTVLTSASMPLDVGPQLQDELADLSTASRHIYAQRAGHNIHLDEPEAVIRALREMIRQCRS